MGKALLIAAAGILLLGSSAGRCFGELPILGAPPACPCAGASIAHESEHFDSCCEKLCAWLTYQPIKKPGISSCCCCKSESCCQPPLYMYFPCMDCGVAMRTFPTCGQGLPPAHILSIQEPGAPAETPAAKPAKEASARIRSIEGDNLTVIDRTIPVSWMADDAKEPSACIRDIAGQNLGSVEQTVPPPSYQPPAPPQIIGSKEPSARIVDIEGEPVSPTDRNGLELPLSKR